MPNELSGAIDAWRDRIVVDRRGHKLGIVADVYLNANNEPQWVLIHMGVFGTRQTVVPVGRARMEGASVRVPYDKSFVTDAPALDEERGFSADHESLLASYYAAAP
jgi:sporulation protein YlmC with PRC-barrel domain